MQLLQRAHGWRAMTDHARRRKFRKICLREHCASGALTPDVVSRGRGGSFRLELRHRADAAPNVRAEHSLTEEHLRKLRETDPHAAWHFNLGDGYLRPTAGPG